MTNESMFATFDGTMLFLRKDIVENPIAVVVIVHGLCEHQERYDYVAAKLEKNKISVYRFDHRGHGRSEGTRVYYKNYSDIADDVNEIVKLAEQENPNVPLFVIGHSMGGYATSLFASRYPNRARGIVLSGALTRMNNDLAALVPEEAKDEDYLPNQLGAGVCSDPAVVQAYQEDPYVEKQISVALMRNLAKGVEWLKQNPTTFVEPVLVMHGAEDGLVNEKDSRDFYGSIASKDKTLMIFAGMQHEIFNEYKKSKVIGEMLEWILSHIE